MPKRPSSLAEQETARMRAVVEASLEWRESVAEWPIEAMYPLIKAVDAYLTCTPPEKTGTCLGREFDGKCRCQPECSTPPEKQKEPDVIGRPMTSNELRRTLGHDRDLSELVEPSAPPRAEEPQRRSLWMTVVFYDGKPEPLVWAGETEARKHYLSARDNWTETFLCQVIEAPRDTYAFGEPDAARPELEAAVNETEARRVRVAQTLSELREEVRRLRARATRAEAERDEWKERAEAAAERMREVEAESKQESHRRDVRILELLTERDSARSELAKLRAGRDALLQALAAEHTKVGENMRQGVPEIDALRYYYGRVGAELLLFAEREGVEP
jgi:hypothetical protein